MPRRSFCSHSLSSSNRKEVALKERTKERVGEANPPRKKRTRPRFLAVAQTKKTIRAEMRAPPCFFLRSPSYPLFLPIGNVLLLPPLPPLKKRVSATGRRCPAALPFFFWSPRPVLFFPSRSCPPFNKIQFARKWRSCRWRGLTKNHPTSKKRASSLVFFFVGGEGGHITPGPSLSLTQKSFFIFICN